MADEYTPTTETVRRSYVGMSTSGMPILSRSADDERRLAGVRFDRWLAEHDREVASRPVTDARAEAERRYPIKNEVTGTTSVANFDRRTGFVACAEWLASRPVTDAEVEAAARAMNDHEPAHPRRPLWAEMDGVEKGYWRKKASAALEAARKTADQ